MCSGSDIMCQYSKHIIQKWKKKINNPQMGNEPDEKCRLYSISQYCDLFFIVQFFLFVRVNINILQAVIRLINYNNNNNSTRRRSDSSLYPMILLTVFYQEQVRFLPLIVIQLYVSVHKNIKAIWDFFKPGAMAGHWARVNLIFTGQYLFSTRQYFSKFVTIF